MHHLNLSRPYSPSPLSISLSVDTSDCVQPCCEYQSVRVGPGLLFSVRHHHLLADGYGAVPHLPPESRREIHQSALEHRGMGISKERVLFVGFFPAEVVEIG